MASSGDRRILRASDADRDAVVEQLRHHGAVGRLDVDELTGRIGQALEAKTLGQLDALLVDLPRGDGAPVAAFEAAPPQAGAWRSPLVRARAAKLLLVDAFLLLFLGLGDHGHDLRGMAFVLVVSVALVIRTTRRVAARAERDRRRAMRTKTPPPFLGP